MAGLAASSGRRLVGRMGAWDMPPEFTASVDSGRRGLAGLEGSGGLESPLEPFLTGEKADMADPGREGSFLAASVAFFCAITVSLREGLLGPTVLLDSPDAGRVVGAAPFGGAFGLFGSFCRSFCAVASRFSIILSDVSYPKHENRVAGFCRRTLRLWRAISWQTPNMWLASSPSLPG